MGKNVFEILLECIKDKEYECWIFEMYLEIVECDMVKDLIKF